MVFRPGKILSPRVMGWSFVSITALTVMAQAQTVSAPTATLYSVRVQSVTASYVATPVRETPADVTIITAAQMARRGITTLTQALQTVPGLMVVPSGGPGNQASVFVQGANSEDVLVLRDGVPVNDPSVANGAFNFGNAGIGDLARIEVVRGPMSSLYGSSAIGGVINLISKRGHGKAHVDYTVGGGFPGQGEASATLSGATGRFDYALTLSTIEQAGFDATARRLSVYAGHRDPFRYKLVSVNLGYRPVAGTRISVIVRARQDGTIYPDLGYPIFDDPYENSYDSNLFIRFGIKSHFFARHWVTSLVVAHSQDDRRYLTLLDPLDPNGFAGNSAYRGDRTTIQFNNIVHLPDAGAFRASDVVFGIVRKRDTAYQDLNESFFGSPYLSTVNAAQTTISGHVGVQTVIARDVSLQGAVRDDAVSGYGNVLTERAGAVLAVPTLATRFRASIGSGFLAPSLYDLYGVDSDGYQGNPALHPERSLGYQAGFTTDLALLGRARAVTLGASYFHDDIKDLIEFAYLANGGSTEQNIAQAQIHGVEATLDVRPAWWLTAHLNYTRTIARDPAAGTELLRRPENAGSLVLDIRPMQRLTIEPVVRYVGRFSDYLYANSGYPSGIGLAKAGTIADLTVSYRINRAVTLFADGRNLTNSRFEPVNGLQIPGQNFLFGLRGRFGL